MGRERESERSSWTVCSSLLLPFTEGFAANKKFIPRMSEEELSALKAKAEAEPGQWVVHKSTALEPSRPSLAAFGYGSRFRSVKEYQKFLVRICVCLRHAVGLLVIVTCLSHANHMLITC